MRTEPRRWLVRGAVALLCTLFAGCADITGLSEPLPAEWSAVTAGAYHTCALDTAGRAYCWGSNSHGQLGSGDASGVSVWPRAVESAERFTQLSAGYSHTCGVSVDSELFCWGSGADGQLGVGAKAGPLLPTRVTGVPRALVVAAGHSHTCAIADDGALFCWGANARGQLGIGDTAAVALPARVVGGSSFAALSAGYEHTCAVTAIGGVAYCWGRNDGAQLGNGSTADEWAPVLVSNPRSYIRVHAGLRNSCGMAPGGQLFCWGSNRELEISPNANALVGNPREMISGESVLDVGLGVGGHVCAARANGQTFCWGASADAKLGATLQTFPVTPIEPAPEERFIALALGLRHSCALNAERQVLCWGFGGSGQLGDGTVRSRAEPAPAGGP